jgi:hypothetical protein
VASALVVAEGHTWMTRSLLARVLMGFEGIPDGVASAGQEVDNGFLRLPE